VLTLYGSRGSGAAAVEAALALASIPYRMVDTASWEPGPGLDELTRVNPLAQVPTLVMHDGSVMTESAAILIHLGLAHPQGGLLPDDASQRAHAIRSRVYIAANCYAAIGIIDYPERYCQDPDDATNERIRLGARKRLHAMWDAFADSFEATPFLCGAEPGALDLLCAVVSKWSGARKHLAKSHPQWSAVLERIETHPAWAAVFARHWPPS